MKKKKKGGDGPKGLPGWMASYADMFTLLMAFFVLLFAMSVVDQELFEQFIVSFNPARADDFISDGGGGDTMLDLGMGLLPGELPPPPPAPIVAPVEGESEEDGRGAAGPGETVADLASMFRTYMAQQFWEGVLEIQVEETEEYLRIILPDDSAMLFNSGQATLLPQAIEILDVLGPLLVEFSQQGNGIVVEGHTDNVPISTAQFSSNWGLSGARATSVVEYLANVWGIEPNYLVPLGRSEYFPVASNLTPEGRAQNRRVEIQVFTTEATGGAIGSWFIIPGTTRP